jgi:hypothetical protein
VKASLSLLRSLLTYPHYLPLILSLSHPHAFLSLTHARPFVVDFFAPSLSLCFAFSAFVSELLLPFFLVISRATTLTSALLDYHLSTLSGELKTEWRIPNKHPLDMFQFYRLFGTTRIPRLGRDETFTFPSLSPSKHIVVLFNNHFFKVDVLTSSGAQVFSFSPFLFVFVVPVPVPVPVLLFFLSSLHLPLFVLLHSFIPFFLCSDPKDFSLSHRSLLETNS